MASAYYIPNGPKNLKSLFPLVPWDEIDEFYVEVLDISEDVVATSPINKICNCAYDEKVRIHFLNKQGTFDTLNFLKPTISHEDTSTEYQNALSYPLSKTDTGIERFNVRSNDTYEAKLKCKETDMPWMQECADSPKMYMEWIGTEGQPDDYVPIVKIAGKFDKLKIVDEFQYDFVLQFKLSNEEINIRN